MLSRAARRAERQLGIPGADGAAAEIVDPAALRQAIRREGKIRIAYADEQGTATDRIVWPLTLIQFEAARLLVAWCELRADFHHFRADRIIGLAALDERYPKTRQALSGPADKI
jgi:predicted DNA-binding transcriptional regulator YafY